MAVIETLAVRVYIQHVGGSRALCGRVLITSLDHEPQQLVCTSVLSFLFPLFPSFLGGGTALRMFISQEFMRRRIVTSKARDPLAGAIDFPLSDAILRSKTNPCYVHKRAQR